MCRGATERRLQALHSVSVEQIRFLVPAAHLGLAKVNAPSQNLILSLRYLFNFRGADVVEILEEVGRQVGFPVMIPVDQGTEFVRSIAWPAGDRS